MLLIHIARTNCSLGNERLLTNSSARLFRESFQKVLVGLCCGVFVFLDKLFRLREKTFCFVQKIFVKVRPVRHE